MVGLVNRNSKEIDRSAFVDQRAQNQDDGQNQKTRHATQRNLNSFLPRLVFVIEFGCFKHGSSSFAHAADHEVSNQVDNESDHEQENTDRKQRLIVR